MAGRVQVVEMEDGWNLMEYGITKLKRFLEGDLQLPFDSILYMTLYTTIYNMCTQKPPHDYSQELYDRYKQVFDDYIDSTVLPSLRDKHAEFMLRELVRRWNDHKLMMRWLTRFFVYLDRYFIPRRDLPSLHEVGLTCFRDLVYQEVGVRAKDAAIALIDEEREGGQIDRALLKNVVDIFVEIGMDELVSYQKDFETAMLEDTTSYYSRKASIWIFEDTCPTYMLKAEDCLKKEKERVAHYLHSSSEDKLLNKVQDQLLFVYESVLLEKENSGFRSLLKDDKVEDISRMYRLYQKVAKGLEPIGAIFKQHITTEGMTLVQQAEDAAYIKAYNTAGGGSHEHVFVRKVIELHDKFMVYVYDCFLNHTIFHKALKEAFETVLNKGVAGSSSAELLASFCDNILKKGCSEKLSDDAIEVSLEKIIKLLAYVSDKDLFAEFYRKRLSRRMLFDKSANDDHERSILSKLKQHCGGQFTSKMEGMVNDLALARENQSHFEEYLGSNSNFRAGLDFTVTVLTTGFWPSYKTGGLNLPNEMSRCIEVFKQFYQTRTKHRRLKWVYSLGSCNIIGKFGSKPIELVVGTYQAAALMLFNTSDSLSYSEIMTQLNLGDEDLIRVLQSLACAKYKILIKEGNGRGISPTDVFTFNSGFTDRMRRIRILLPQTDDRKKVVEEVDKDRRYAIDASIVRIMKGRKKLGYPHLITECIEQLSQMFKPNFKEIKKRIEDLITRDYIERDAKNPRIFRYVA